MHYLITKCVGYTVPISPSRQFGAIPALISQLHNEDAKVVMPVLGALRNLSFGRSNDENKLMMVREQGLQELMLALKMSRIMEVEYKNIPCANCFFVVKTL